MLKNEYYGARVGFISSFITCYHDAQHLFLLKIKEEHCLLKIYLESTCIKQIIGETSDNVWNQVEIHQKFSGLYLFEIKDELIQEKLHILKSESIICISDNWTNSQQLKKVFD